MKATPSEIKQCDCYRGFLKLDVFDRLVALEQLTDLPSYTLLRCGHVLGTETLPLLQAAMRELNRVADFSPAGLPRSPWPYSSLVAPTGDFNESEQTAKYGGVNHKLALTDPYYLCECDECSARHGTHPADCSCRLCQAFGAEFDDEN